jgi:hypothetical protein
MSDVTNLIDAVNRDAMRAAVERLRRSRQESDAATRRDGFKSGRIWAMNRAEAKELERLEDWRLSGGNDHERTFEYKRSAYCPSAGEHLVFCIRPEFDGDCGEANGFWSQNVGDDYESLMCDDGFVRGFAEGALEFWDAAKGQP